MASTAMKTVEGHQGATRPDCTPAPGANRALACAALAAGFALALAWLAQSSAGPGFALLFLAPLFLALHSAAPTRCPSIRVKTFSWPSPPPGRAPRPDQAFGLPGPAASAAARV